jgi:hypothetical protein
MTLNGYDIKTAVVAGAIANKYGNGGEPWIRLSWIAGLRRLGYRVLFIEQVPLGTRIVERSESGADDDAHVVCLDWYRRIIDEFGLAGCAALIGADGRDIDGVTYDDALAFARSADVLVNISGHLTLPALKDAPRRKVFVDEDPGFTQFWYADGTAREHVDGHDVYFTLGRNIGRDDCPIPSCGFTWLPLRTPVVLEDWPMISAGPGSRDIAFTTVGSWRGPFGVISYGGIQYGLKVHEFRKFIDLPRRVPPPVAFEAALKIHPADERDLALLQQSGWRVVNPRHGMADPWTFREYVQSSSAEFSVAQGLYVGTNSGWFSDRTARYLASGKPALVQDTGFSRELPTGEGLIAFTTLDEAVEGAARIRRDYGRHARAARAIAERFFDSDRILLDVLEEVGLPALAVN